MRTTLKRGVGRGATQNGGNGHAIYPPSAVSSVVRYQQPPKTRKGLGIFGRILLFVLLLVVGVGLAAAGGALLWLHESISAVRAHSIDVKQAQKQLNVSRPGHAAIALVIGYDKRLGTDASDISRSDTVMMIRADPATNTISMLSIPRDLGVPIYCPHSGQTSLGVQKVNQAYALCGSAGTVDTVKHFSNLPINYLITVNFHGFKEIVDKIGGIWLDIDRRYYHVNNGTAAQNYANINIQPGYQLVDGENALDFVRYRHTDDDYHRIARQQEFVRALKQQFAHKFSFTELPSIVSTLTKNVEVGGNPSDKTVLSWLLFGMTLPGGHFFQDRIQGVTGDSMTSTAPANIQSALYQFTHPDTGSSKAANAAALGVKVKPKVPPAPAPSKTSVLVLNGNGVAGSAADGAYLLRQRGYVTVLPPGNASPNAPTQGYFHTTIYYDKRQQGSQAAANALSKVIVPSAVGPLPKDPKLRALDPGAMLTVVVGETFHNQLVAPDPDAVRAEAPAAQRPRRRLHGARPPEGLRAPCPVQARGADGTRTLVVSGRSVRRRRESPLLDRQAPQGDPARLQDRRRRVLGDRGDGYAESARPGRPELPPGDQGPHVHPLLHRLEPAHGRAARPRQELLGREHAARLALERDDARDRDRAQTTNTVQVESGAMASVGIFGAGWVGLVTGVCFAELGHDVVVRDVVPEKIERAPRRGGAVPRDRRSRAARAPPRPPPVHTRGDRSRGLPVPLRVRRHAADEVRRRRPLARVERRRRPARARRARDPRDEVDGAGRDGGEDSPRSRGARSGRDRVRLEPRVPGRGHGRARLHAPRPDRDRRVRRRGR